MFERNKQRRLHVNTEFVINGERIRGLKHKQLETFEKKVDEMADSSQKEEAKFLLLAIQVARKIVIEREEIKIYLETEECGKFCEDWRIKGNKELYNKLIETIKL